MTRPRMSLRACLLSLALMTLLAFFGSTVSAQSPLTLRDQVYRSPTWGYSIRWSSDEWSVLADQSDNGIDTLILGDDADNQVTFIGGLPFADASACLDEAVDRVLSIPDVTNSQIAASMSGASEEFRSEISSHVLYQIRLEPESLPGPVDYVVYHQCEVLAPDGVMLLRTFVGPTAVFDASFAKIAGLVESVVIPRSVQRLHAGEHSGSEDISPFSVLFPSFPRVLFDNIGRERATMTVVDFCCYPNSAEEASQINGFDVAVLIEISGDRPLPVDPDLFVGEVKSVYGGEPKVATATVALWEGESANTKPAEPITLQPGDRATLLLRFGTPGGNYSLSLIYADPELNEGKEILECLWGCSRAGGAAPVLVDME